MRLIPFTLMAVWLLCQTPVFSYSSSSTLQPLSFSGGPILNEELVKLRFQIMNAPFAPVYNDDVAAYLRRYLTYGFKDTERMLGRSKMLFPIFEHYLEMHGLPSELKFLPMVESSLIPYAVSTSGAAGLWQFMPNTGRHHGLTIDTYLDERKDPYRSTEAAVKYLKKLHGRFGKWDLALAAYNCGPSRLGRIIRETGSDDFWKIKSQLPRETQRYVCRYLAACYLGTYYQLHGLRPVLPEETKSEVMAARVYESVSLTNVSQLTGVEVAVLRQLNPSFKRNYVPAKRDGLYLVLPRSSWYDYIEGKKTADVAVRP